MTHSYSYLRPDHILVYEVLFPKTYSKNLSGNFSISFASSPSSSLLDYFHQAISTSSHRGWFRDYLQASGHSFAWKEVLHLCPLVCQCCLKGILSLLLDSGLGGLAGRMTFSMVLKCVLPKSQVHACQKGEICRIPGWLMSSAWESGPLENWMVIAPSKQSKRRRQGRRNSFVC